MPVEKEGAGRNQSNEPVQDYKAYVVHLEGYTYRYLKSLAAYDIDMPVLMRDKICDANVRSDIVLTPAVLKYIIIRLEAVDANNLPHLHKKSIQRTLLFLYSVK